MPQTRYLGSKLKLAGWLEAVFRGLEFDTALDAFGGTASVSYILKRMGKKVHYNDLLQFNCWVGKALIENDHRRIGPLETATALEAKEYPYQDVIARNFAGIYYLGQENAWLDRVAQNIARVEDQALRAGLYWSLFQSCLSKRPYNLFHRKNLEVRTSDVKRSFGNKATWDRPFEEHFQNFVTEFNHAVFDNQRANLATCMDAMALPTGHDLVYLDTPYVPRVGSITDYAGFYHFLEGICRYEEWESLIDGGSRHRRMVTNPCPWQERKKIGTAFRDLLEKFRASQLVVSYRSDGVPSIEEIIGILKSMGKEVRVESREYRYALSTNRTSSEILIIAT